MKLIKYAHANDNKVMEKLLDNNNQILACAECESNFDFSVGEQKFYNSKGLLPPRRCPTCRKEARAKRDAVHEGQLEQHRGQETKATIGDVIAKYLGGNP